MNGRPLARLIATLALLMLGAVALARLPLDYFPRRSFPELTVGLALPDDLDPGAVSRDWMEPIESAARSLGGVKAMAGEVRANGGELKVRFAPGTDPERKAARLDSELARLRDRLPEGATLWVDPAAEQEGDLLAIVWLTGVRSDAEARAAAEMLRTVPGVRDAQALGVRDEEVRVTLAAGSLDPWGLAGTVLAAARQAVRVPALGWSQVGDRRRSVVAVGEGGRDFKWIPIPSGGGTVPLGTLAAIEDRSRPAQAIVRFQGEPARALFVWRSTVASLLAVDRALRQRLDELPAGLRGTVGWSDADPLRVFLRRLFLAGLLTAGLAAAVGAWLAGRRGALALGLAGPAAVAAAANAFLLAGVPLNVTTLTALALAAAGVLPLAAMRLSRRQGAWAWSLTAVAAAAAVPVAVALAGAELGPLLAEPARALMLAVVAGVGAVCLVPVPQQHRTDRSDLSDPSDLSAGFGWRRPLRASLRDPGTAVLIAATATYAGFALFGGALVPRPGSLQPDPGRLSLTLRLPRGTPLEETARRMETLEKVLAKSAEVERFWTYSTPGLSQAVAELASGSRDAGSRRRLGLRLRYEAAGAGALEITSGVRASEGRGSGFLTELEDRPDTDDEATIYRIILRGTNLPAVQAAYVRILQRLGSLKVRPYWITGLGDPAIQLVLRPRLGTNPAEATEVARRLRLASAPPPSIPLPSAPGGAKRSLTVVPAGTPEDPDRAIPQMSALLGRPLPMDGRVIVPAALLAPSEEALQPRIPRQSGRFVIPVEVRLPLSVVDARKDFRQRVDRSLGQLPLPTGCDLERPPLDGSVHRRERLRLIALALAVPVLLFAVAACRLGSLSRGLATLVPLGLGLVAALPPVSFQAGQVDELTVFALAAALVLALPCAAEMAAAPGGTGARLYHAVRSQGPWLLAAAPLVALALASPALGIDTAPWALPLQAAAVAGGVSLAASLLLVPALRVAGVHLRQRDPEEVRRRRRPPAWTAPGEPGTVGAALCGRPAPKGHHPPAQGGHIGPPLQESALGEPVLEVRSLTKAYGRSVPALYRTSFTLTPGIVGLLGPNGAGKTTLLRILTGLLEPTRGKVLYRGIAIGPENLAEYRVRIGFLPQEFNAYPGFTAEQFLDHWALERGMDDARQRREEIERLLAAVGLAEHAGRKVRDYSGGMRQRVGIARALLNAPPILIVDEPTTGLDVESRNRFRQILLEQASERIVIFSTHIASDIEAAARRILLLHRGRLRFDGPPEELVERARGQVFRALVSDADLLAFGHRYRTTSRVRVLEGIEVRAIAKPGEPVAGDLVEPNLEEAYLAEIDRAEIRSRMLDSVP